MKIEHLSPTSIRLYIQDREEFYRKYVLKRKREDEKQTQPMAIGAAFDAFIKSYLYKLLINKNDPMFDLQTLFEEQVEEHNRDWAYPRGQELFNWYVQVGAVGDLLHDLDHALEQPRFEYKLSSQVENVPLLGYPDLFFVSRNNVPVIIDWKVNGYCSRARTSPEPGFVRILPNRIPHRDCVPWDHKGILINKQGKMKEDWLMQLTIYAWLFGVQVGDEVVVGIDQLLNDRDRVAQHRILSPLHYQLKLINQIKEIWEVANSNHFFRELSEEESIARCQMIEAENNESDLFNRMMN